MQLSEAQLFDMRTDFSVFSDRLAEACRARNMTRDSLSRSIGLGGRREVEFLLHGLKAIDLYRLTQIADRLDVSIDWLLGRTNVMEVIETPEPPRTRTRTRAKKVNPVT
jgi:transcriptional regulator with XRE-family HTH domain